MRSGSSRPTWKSATAEGERPLAAGAVAEPPQIRWQVHPLAAFHWRRWGDEWTVFDAGSGQTHQMDMLTALVVIALEESGAADAAELSAQLCASSLADHEAPEIARNLDDVLKRLLNGGVIEPVSR